MIFAKYVALMLFGFTLFVGYQEYAKHEQRTDAQHNLSQRCDALATAMNSAVDIQDMHSNHPDSYSYQRATEDLNKARAQYQACALEEATQSKQ